MKQIPMTIEGAKKLRLELKFLKNTLRPKIISSIIEARKNGDLKENSEYIAAREQQSFCEGRINSIENKLAYAQIIDISKFKNNGRIIFGVTITIYNLIDKKKKTYKIVGEDEADFRKNLISITSPIARGLIGKTIGDIVLIHTPKGKIRFKVLKVEYL